MCRNPSSIKVLAVASGGGHWVQLRRLRPAWNGCRVTYVTTHPGYEDEIARDVDFDTFGKDQFFIVPDAHRGKKLRLLYQCAVILFILLRVRPHAVVTTGAAPGFFAIWLGKQLGARTIWVDSIANADEMSLSGRKAAPYADLWLTQWEHLSSSPEDARAPLYKGSVV